MEINTLVEVESSFCLSYFVMHLDLLSDRYILFITYPNGHTYSQPFTITQITEWKSHYKEHESIGKAFWHVLKNGESILISKG
jgi:hypothetical protein